MKKLTKEEDKAKKEAARKKAAERNCEKCGRNRFKTVEKKEGVLLKVACRKCGTVRILEEFEKAKAEKEKAA